MDLRLTAEQEHLRAEAREWLVANAPDQRLPYVGTAEGFAAHREWEKKLFDAGLAAVDWPEEFGGRGLDPLSSAIFYDEYLRCGAPVRLNRIGIGLVGPTLLDFGTPEQLDRWLAGTLSSEIFWCQGFSEPGAGSDLAALRTRGEVDGNNLVINGQKIWTSYGKFANWMIALVRTDPTSVGHRGITFVAIELSSPGVDVRPITQLNGHSDFCEVFFDDVVVPLDNVIDQVGNGWAVAMACLTYERGGGQSTAAHVHELLDEVIAMMTPQQRADPLVRHEVGRLYEKIEAYRHLQLQVLSRKVQGKRPERRALMIKLWWSELQVQIYELGLDILGPAAQLRDGPPAGESNFRGRYWLARASQIYAGTNEIQRNIIAERGLGMPKEPRRAV